MRHTDLYLETDSPHRLIFTHPHHNGVLFAAGFTLLWLVVNSMTEVGWGFHLFCAFFIAFGLVAASRRHRIDFDLRTRTYTSLKGSWAKVTTQQGSIEDLEGVLLVKEWVRVQTRYYKTWTVSLLFHPPLETVSVLSTKDEKDAWQRFEHFAEALGIPAIDRTSACPSSKALRPCVMPYACEE